MSGFPSEFAAPRECDHNWEVVSMVFETQFLGPNGSVNVRQPDIDRGRTYFICRGCASHTYMTTQWIGCRMYGSEDMIPDDGKRHGYGFSRPAWSADNEGDELEDE